MPGKSVKNWKVYHALRRKRYSKRSAARITNAMAKRRGKRRKRTGYGGFKRGR